MSVVSQDFWKSCTGVTIVGSRDNAMGAIPAMEVCRVTCGDNGNVLRRRAVPHGMDPRSLNDHSFATRTAA
jgi:hypothetical protein